MRGMDILAPLALLGFSTILVVLSYSLNAYVRHQEDIIDAGGSKTIYVLFHLLCTGLCYLLYFLCFCFVVPLFLYLFLQWAESRSAKSAISIKDTYKEYASEAHRLLYDEAERHDAFDDDIDITDNNVIPFNKGP